MGTRCTVHFHWQERAEPMAIVYRHWDGYPDNMLVTLGMFFAAVQEQTKDTRFNDPWYLAAKYVVWQADQYTVRHNWETGQEEKAEMLDFLSVGVVVEDPADIEYRYHIHCGHYDGNVPKVTWEAVPWE